MEGHHQSDRPGVRIGAVIAVAIAVAVGVWLLFLRDDDESSAPAELGQPFIGSVDDIGGLADSAGHTVYWAGEQPDTELELTEYQDGRVYVRYLTGGVAAGDPNPSYLTVGSYPFADAYGALEALGRREGYVRSDLDDGTIVVHNSDAPQSVYLAKEGEDVQVEVFSPDPAQALEIAESGSVVPAA
jgi:hypothetical protein